MNVIGYLAILPIIKMKNESFVDEWLIIITLLSGFQVIEASAKNNIIRLISNRKYKVYNIINEASYLLFLFLIYSVFGTIFIAYNYSDAILFWISLVLSNYVSMNIYIKSYILQGAGKVAISQKKLSTIKFIFMTSLFFLFLLLDDINTISIVYILISTICLLLEKTLIYKIIFVKKTFMKDTNKMLISNVGGFLIYRVIVLLSAIYVDGSVQKQYMLTYMMLMTLQNLSSILLITEFSKFSKSTYNKKSLKKVYLLTNFIFIFMSVFLMLFLEDINLFFYGTFDIPKIYIIIMWVTVALELNHSTSQTFLNSKSRFDYVTPSLITGIAIVLCVLVLSNFGLLIFIFAPFVIQMMYNNWKWHYEVYKI